MTANNPGLASLDRDIFSAMATAGLAESATYFPPDHSAPTSCTIFWDEEPQPLADHAEQYETRTTFSVQRCQLPRQGVDRDGMFRVAGDAYKVDGIDDTDASVQRVTVYKSEAESWPA